tara:strand:+ start:1022 stop:1315 length:294 start_codon:yes stop_codon:yes gene_type:complete
MSPNNKKKLIVLRRKLDSLDNQLFKILKKRFNIVKNVLKLKEKKSEIIDRKRINVILGNIKKKSKKNKIDSKITLRVWKSMINAFIQYEFRNFKKKK